MKIGIDVGGTFTDAVAIDDDGAILTVKTPSTPDDPSRGVMDALDQLASGFGLTVTELLRRKPVLIHGTTVATNIVIERTGAEIGLITSEGFRDLLELRDGTKTGRYRLRVPFPDPVIPRPLRLEVPERLSFDGSTRVPLDEARLAEVVAALRESAVEAVVVCFLHAHRNPENELRVRDFLQACGWNVYLCLSHEMLPKEGEYERLSTTVASAYVGPALQAYLSRLEERIAAAGGQVPIMIMQSNGGVLPLGETSRKAFGAITSGPAGGAVAGALFARENGLSRAVTYDMGGTSTDVCLIEEAVPLERQRSQIASFHIAAPAIDILALGAGGGSIAHIDAGGILELGPRSAGADPGPACYGRGGREPTVTDASVVMGLLSPESFLGGRFRLDADAAETVIRTRIADPLGIPVEDAALAIHELASSKITEGIRAATVRRGMDPREFTLLSFGGAGGVHADTVARELQIPRTIIPRQASVLSALGFLAADVRHDFVRSLGVVVDEDRAEALREALLALRRQGQQVLASEGFVGEAVQYRYFADCRYGGQIHTVPVPVDGSELELDQRSLAATVRGRFEERYQELYKHHHPGQPCLVETCRVAAFGRLDPVRLPRLPRADSPDPAAARVGERDIYLGRWQTAAVFRFDNLLPGMIVHGPALVESATTTILVLPGSRAEADAWCSLGIAGEPMA